MMGLKLSTIIYLFMRMMNLDENYFESHMESSFCNIESSGMLYRMAVESHVQNSFGFNVGEKNECKEKSKSKLMELFR